MKRFAVVLLVLLIPLALFAQAKQTPEQKVLKDMGLSDSQISQIIDIRTSTLTAVRQDAAQIRVLRAQMDKALLAAAASVDVNAVNGLVDQITQTRADMQKKLVAAQLQLRKIMGDDNFRAYERFLHPRNHRFAAMRNMMRQGGPALFNDRADGQLAPAAGATGSN